MGQRKDVKQQDIAKELGISVVSVSNVLNGKKGVSDELRRQILEKAEKLGYKRNVVSKQKEEKIYKIGIIIAGRYVKEYPSFYMEVYRQVAKLLLKKGSFTVLEIVDEDEEKLQYNKMPFDDTEIHGILLIGEMNPLYVRKVKKRSGVPVICVDFYSVEGDLDYIVTDSFHGMQMVTQRLIDYGHKKIGFIGTIYATNSIMDRYMGYCKALQVNGLREYEEWVIDDREKDGYGYILDFELPEELPTAFVCNCDKSAYILIEKLNQKGIRVPEDISVVGFDNFYSLPGKERELVTYKNDIRAIALVSINTLIKRVEGKEKPEGVRVIEGNVVDGDTIRRLEI